MGNIMKLASVDRVKDSVDLAVLLHLFLFRVVRRTSSLIKTAGIAGTFSQPRIKGRAAFLPR